VEAFPVLEIDLDGDPSAIQTMEDKQKKPREKICPANLDPALASKMQEYSIAAFNALQIRDFARVDIRLDENNNIYLLEINSMASLGRTGSYVYAAKIAGYDYKSLVNKMLDVAVVRYFADANFTEENEDDGEEIPLSVKIRSFLRIRQEQTTKLLSQIVDLNTYVRNIEGVNKLGMTIKRSLLQLGFSCEDFPQVEVGNVLFFSNTKETEYDFLLLGNLDNTTKISQQEYFKQSEQKFYGSGIWEHKGGLVTMLLALQSLKFARLLRKSKVAILLTTDDSLHGRFGQAIITQKSEQAKYVIGLHGAFLNGGIVTSRSGAALYKCSMNLKQLDKAENVPLAVHGFTKLISSYTELSNMENGLVVSPGELKLNSSITEPYAHGEAVLSVRFNQNSQIELIDEKIRKLIPTKNKEVVHFQIEGGERRPAMEYNDKVEFLWKEINLLSKKLGIRVRKEHRWSSSDIAFCSPNAHLIDGMGPVGVKDFKKSEYILKHSLNEKAALLAMLIKNLS
jgi:D-alanine-D-alanine ligase